VREAALGAMRAACGADDDDDGVISSSSSRPAISEVVVSMTDLIHAVGNTKALLSDKSKAKQFSEVLNTGSWG
jgi:hypothetical protein